MREPAEDDGPLRDLLEDIIRDQARMQRSINRLHHERRSLTSLIHSFALALEHKGALDRNDFAVILSAQINGLTKAGAAPEAIEYVREFQAALLQPRPDQIPDKMN